MTCVLLAEDDTDTTEIIAAGLRDEGFTVLCTADGEAALQQGMSKQPDLLILDRMLPGMDGLTVLKRLRAAGINVPALMLTALGGIEDRVTGLDAGADDYLVKPFALSELVARLNALLRRANEIGSQTTLEVGSIGLNHTKKGPIARIS